jgi:hypothetical protein
MFLLLVRMLGLAEAKYWAEYLGLAHRRSYVLLASQVASDDLTQKFGGIEGLPTTMLYVRQGILRKKVIGFEYTDIIESELKPIL